MRPIHVFTAAVGSQAGALVLLRTAWGYPVTPGEAAWKMSSAVIAGAAAAWVWRALVRWVDVE